MLLSGSVYSKVLEMDSGISVITPSPAAPRPWKVAYVLHGLCGSHRNWNDYTLLPLYARELPVAFVMPDVGRSFYSDMKCGQRFFTYVPEELPEICAATFNISAAPGDTYVFGGSMGGYGALRCALARPDRFGGCCALSSACLFLQERIAQMSALGNLDLVREQLGPQLVRDFQGILGEELTPRPQDELLTLARAAAASGLMPKFYSCCGTEDDLRDDNARFAAAMRELGFDFTYEERAGGHKWEFFDQALKAGIEFFFGNIS